MGGPPFVPYMLPMAFSKTANLPRDEAPGDVPAKLGLGELRPDEQDDVLVSSIPAERWNLERRLTTRLEVWVLTPTGPP